MANDIIDIVVTDNSDNVQLNVTPNLVSINVSQTSGNIIGSNYFLASTFSALPITGDTTTLYVINDTSLMYRWSGSAYTQINSSAVVAWGQITGTLSGQTDLQNALNAKAPLASPTFTGTVSGITKSMVGLSNVDNTSDVNKPVSTATQTALDLKAPIASPTFTGTVSGVTKAMVGLGNVDNTSDVNKPISSATQTSLDTKAPIASPTFTGTVSGITKAMVGLGNVDNTSDVNKPISSATQTALDTKAPLASPTFTGTVSGITKTMVGLGNVDNTTDLNKPISTATQTALNLKYDASNPNGYTTNVGTVTSVGGTGTVSGLSLSGTVTTSGNLTLGGTLSLTSGNVTTALGYTPYNATNPSNYISGITSGNVTTALGYTPENAANKGVANGYASLDGGGLVPSTQLPSYVDDVLEFADLAAFPASGATGKIYVALDTNKIYRWSGATYIEVSPTVGTIWGGITGTLSNQTDLQNALNAKQDDLNGTGFVKASGTTITYDNSTYYPYPTGDTTQYVGGDGSLIAFPIAGQSGTIVRLVRNNTGATLTKGTVIYISGATGNNPVVSKAIATGDATSAQTFGLCQANIANNATGYVVVMGDLIGLDTSAFTEGQQVYLSGTVAGTFTSTKQYAPIHLVYIGVITRSHPTQGQIEVKIQNGYELDEIHNVSAQSPANNDIIAYNTTNSLWEKKSIATTLGFTPVTNARTITINGTALDLSADRSYSVGTVTSVSALTLGTTGTDVSSSVATGTTTPVITLNIPTASATNRGALSSADWTTFNSKQGAITLTTTGTSGAATFSAGTLNIPQYQAALTNPVTGTGTTNYITKWTSSSAVGNSQIFDNGTNVGIGTSSPNNLLEVYTSVLGLSNPFRITNAFGAIGANVEMMMSSAGNSAGVRLRCEAPGGSNQDFSLYVTSANTLRSTPSIFVQGSSGNVGIGTSSPATQLDVRGTPSADWGNLTLFDTRTAATGQGGVITFSGYKTSTTAANIFAKITGANESGNGTENGYLSFITNNGSAYSERMRITSSGNVGIGITGPANLLSVRGTIDVVSTTNNPTTSFLRLATFPDGRWGSYVSSDSNYGAELSTNLKLGTNLGGTYFDRMTVSANGSIGAPSGTNIYNASDARLKRNIETLDTGLNKVMSLNPVKFNWIENYEPSEEGKDMLGFIAQEVLKCIPEAVENFASSKVIVNGEEIDNVLRVNEKFIIPVLVKAIQELSTEIELLKAK